MGFFSWMYADTGNQESMMIGEHAYLPQPKEFGKVISGRYDGYGHLYSKDIYCLVADWNRKYLSAHPDFLIKSEGKKVSDFSWYPYYRDLSLDPNEVVREWKKAVKGEWPEYRQIGIDIACYDEDNASLPFPIKVCKQEQIYEEVGAGSIRAENQGCY